MMKVIRLALFWLAACSPAFAQVGQIPTYLQPAPSGGACSQATSFLARTSGLNGTQTTAYTNLICGLVTDGIITGTMAGSGTGASACGSLLDTLYIFATNTTTTANLNLCSTSFSITASGSPTFTANAGYTGDGSTALLSTNYTPSTASGNYTQNSASYGVCVLNNRTTANFNDIDIASDDGSGRTGAFWLDPLETATEAQFSVNTATSITGGTTSTSQGQWIAVRTGASAEALYLNGNTTPFLSDTNSSTGLSSVPVVILGRNGDVAFSTDQVGSAFLGAQLTGTQMNNLYNRLHTYFAAVGASGC